MAKENPEAPQPDTGRHLHSDLMGTLDPISLNVALAGEQHIVFSEMTHLTQLDIMQPSSSYSQ